MPSFDQKYQVLIKDIMENGVAEVSERTRHETKAIPGAHFSIDIEREGFPLLSLRKIPIKLFVAEQAWFLLGSRKPEDFLRKYTKIWDDFTNPGDVITAAYGYRWRKHFGRDQIESLIKLLKEEPSSRHGVVISWGPSADGLSSTFKRKNVPCPFAFTVNIIGERLHMHNIIRSNDVMLGLPHDVAGFALLQCLISQELGVSPGIYSHSISNAHIYDIHYDAAREMIGRKNSGQKPIKLALPKQAMKLLENRNEAVLSEIVANPESQYAPLPPIKGLKIVL